MQPWARAAVQEGQWRPQEARPGQGGAGVGGKGYAWAYRYCRSACTETHGHAVAGNQALAFDCTPLRRHHVKQRTGWSRVHIPSNEVQPARRSNRSHVLHAGLL